MWLDSSAAALASASPAAQSSVVDTSTAPQPPRTEQEGGGGKSHATNPSPDHSLRLVTWPSDTDIVYITGTNKLKLIAQGTLLHSILLNAFENVRASLLFDYSFPDGAAIPTVIRRCLLDAAAESHHSNGLYVRERLLDDAKYLTDLTRLVSVS